MVRFNSHSEISGHALISCRRVAVKGVYPQWSTDAPNAKMKSWNVSDLRVRSISFAPARRDVIDREKILTSTDRSS